MNIVFLGLKRLCIVQSPLVDFKTLLSAGVFSLPPPLLQYFKRRRAVLFYETVHSEKEDNIGNRGCNKHQMFQAHDL